MHGFFVIGKKTTDPGRMRKGLTDLFYQCIAVHRVRRYQRTVHRRILWKYPGTRGQADLIEFQCMESRGIMYLLVVEYLGYCTREENARFDGESMVVGFGDNGSVFIEKWATDARY